MRRFFSGGLSFREFWFLVTRSDQVKLLSASCFAVDVVVVVTFLLIYLLSLVVFFFIL